LADRIAPDVVPDVKLLVSELITNSVKYGGLGAVALKVDTTTPAHAGIEASTRAPASCRSRATARPPADLRTRPPPRVAYGPD
jgi:hypothetical protein